MTATPPEPDFSPQEGHAPPTVPLAYPPPSSFPPSASPPPSAYPVHYSPPPSGFPSPSAYPPSGFPSPSAYPPSAYPPPLYPPPPDPSPQDLAGPRRKIGPLRIITGVMWAVIAVICAVGAVGEWPIGLHTAAVLCLVIAVGAAWYDYRVWKFKARRFLL
jgi:hypothetical protein